MTSWDISTGLSIVDIARQRSELYPDDPFCQFDDGPWHSYGDLWTAASSFATSLAALGVRPGDRVAVFMGKRFEYVAALFATMLAGGVYVPANCEYTIEQLAALISDCSPTVLLTDAHYEATALSAATLDQTDSTTVASVDDPVSSERTVRFSRVNTHFSRFDPERVSSDQAAVIMYTSGTTGKPKGVTFSHGNVVYEAMLKGLPRSSRDRGFNFFPLHHFNGGFGQIVPVVYKGASVVFLADFDPVDFGSQLKRHGATVSAVNSNHVLALLQQRPSANDHDHDCRYMTLGLKLDPATHRAFEERYATRLLGVYGLTESVGQFIQEQIEYLTSPYSSGRPLPGYEVSIIDEQGSHLPSGETGEVVVRSTSKHGFFLGYWNDPQRTSQMLSDEWMRTGDLGLMEDDGRFVYLQRTADLTRRQGKRTAPCQTEDLLREHIEVHDAAVIGLADHPDHETLVALVILRSGLSSADAERILVELNELCAERANPLLVPDYLINTDSLPKDILGKLDRKKLRAELKVRIANTGKETAP